MMENGFPRWFTEEEAGPLRVSPEFIIPDTSYQYPGQLPSYNNSIYQPYQPYHATSSTYYVNDQYIGDPYNYSGFPNMVSAYPETPLQAFGPSMTNSTVDLRFLEHNNSGSVYVDPDFNIRPAIVQPEPEPDPLARVLPPLPLRRQLDDTQPPSPPPSSHSARLRRQHRERCAYTNNTTRKPRAKKDPKTKQKTHSEVGIKVPFSEMAAAAPKKMPTFDIETFISRPAEDRICAATGRVMRPLNPFMLYRKAYLSYAKALNARLGDQQQAASRLTAASWRMEDRAVKDRFAEYARVEKANHDLAHPGYKYKPGQAGGKKAKSKNKSSEEKSPVGDEFYGALDEFIV